MIARGVDRQEWWRREVEKEGERETSVVEERGRERGRERETSVAEERGIERRRERDKFGVGER